MRRAARRPALLSLALLSLAPRAALAQSAPPPSVARRAARFTWDRDVLRMDVAYRDALDAAVQAKLASGLPTTIVTRVYLFRESGGDALALTGKTCRVVYDLWDEVYQITLTQPGAADAQAVAPNVEGVLRRCTEAQGLVVADRAMLAGGGAFYVAALVEVNPVSPEMVERVRRWVTRPTGSNGLAPGDALFGSFVGLFVARIGGADRTLQFRTQPFTQ